MVLPLVAGVESIEPIYFLLWDLGIIIIAATIFNFIARALKQPPLLAYILAGFFIYTAFPFITGAVLGEPVHLFLGDLDVIRMFSELGIAFLLFSIGVETDLGKLRKLSSTVIVGGVLQVFFTAAFVFVLMTFFNALTFMETVYLSLILSFSSTMLVVKLLSDAFSLDTMHGRLMIGFLLVQDILIIIMLPILGNLGNLANPEFFIGFFFSGAALIVLALFLSRFVYPFLFRFSVRSPEMLYLSALTSCFGFILFSYFFLDIPLGIGGFVAGLSLSMLPYNFQIYDEIRGIRDFFVTIFLVTLGLQISFGFIGILWKMVLFAFAVVFILKPILFYIISYLSGYGKRVSIFVALSLAQVSEFSFIIASQGLEDGVLNPDFYSATVFIIAFSMLFTPYIFKYQNAFYSFFNRASRSFPRIFKKGRFHSKVDWLEEGEKMDNHIVIVGTGVIGGSIAKTLSGKSAMIAMDQDPDVVERLKKEKINIFLGEADNKAIWRKLHLEKARLLVSAVPNIAATIKLMGYAKEINPDLVVFARAHTFEDAAKLYENGADFVCMPEVVGSNVFIKTIMEYLETNALFHINVLHDEIVQYLKERSKDERKKGTARHRDWM